MRIRSLKSVLWWLAQPLLLTLTGCGSYVAYDVFMGDSITKAWSLPGVNLGVSGNTTSQMLVRFPSEVPGHGYRVFVLLGGVNDLLRGLSPEEAFANIALMAKAARQAQMTVVLCELTPVYRDDQPILDPDIRALNTAIEQLVQSDHYLLVDYYDPMYGHPEYFRDGLHPNAQGYAVMDEALLPVLASISSQ